MRAGVFPRIYAFLAIFFNFRAAKLYSGAVQPFAVCWMRFSVAILSMAFV